MTTATANPNHVNKNSSDAKSAVSSCPLELKNIQLIPLRYGLVERHAPEGLPMPYRLQSRPMGIRLLRDGFLYVIVDNRADQPPQLHEFQLKDGLVTGLLFKGSKVTANKRQGSGPTHLVYKRSDQLAVCYSEIQWSARKCQQVLTSKRDRNQLMQSLQLSDTITPEAGNGNLLAPRFAEKWLAEANEPAPTKNPALPDDEQQDYSWEAFSRFARTGIGKIKSQILGGYSNDHLYLLVRDDLGLMRDLATHQDMVSSWLRGWADSDETQRLMHTASYIESLYASDLLRSSAAAEMWPDLTDEQRQSIADYLEAKHRPGKSRIDHYQDKSFYDSKETRDAWYRMKSALGEWKFRQYEDQIDAMDDAIDERLHGAKFGQKGIADLVRLPQMDAFLREQRAKQARWHQRLAQITADRIQLLNDNILDKATWYFDPQLPEQADGCIETQEVCLHDFVRCDQSLAAVTQLITNHPELVFPHFYTLPLEASGKLVRTEAASLITQSAKVFGEALTAGDSAASLNAMIAKFGKLADSLGLANLNLSKEGQAFKVQRNAQLYTPVQLELADQFQRQLAVAQRNLSMIDMGQALRSRPICNAIMAATAEALASHGLTLDGGGLNDIHGFIRDTQRLNELQRQANNLRGPGRRRIKVEAKAAERRMIALINPLLPSPGPGQAGLTFAGFKGDELAEISARADDFHHGRPVTAVAKAMFGPINATVSGAAMLFAWYKLKMFWETANEQMALDPEDRRIDVLTNATAGAIGATAAAGVFLTSNALDALLANHHSAGHQYRYVSKLGFTTAVLAVFSFGPAMLSDLINAQTWGDNWIKAQSRGDSRLAHSASVAMAGHAGMAVVDGIGFVRSGQLLWTMIAKRANQQAVLLASARLLSLLRAVTPWGIALTALQLSGEYLYNQRNRSELEHWLETSPWGHKPVQRDLADELLELVQINASPSAQLLATNSGDSTQLLLRLPALTLATLEQAELTIVRYPFAGNGQGQSLHEQILHHAASAAEQQPNALLQLALPISSAELEQWQGMRLLISYRALASNQTPLHYWGDISIDAGLKAGLYMPKQAARRTNPNSIGASSSELARLNPKTQLITLERANGVLGQNNGQAITPMDLTLNQAASITHG